MKVASKKKYSEGFFDLHQAQSISSAEQVIPLVRKFISPGSVIDIGCGNGTWLSVWKKSGIADILGIDGDYVQKEQILIEKDEFIAHDLSTPFRLERKFDLATSLEVGEHIDGKYAEIFVDTIAKLSDVILFSAAIPGQEGTFHINEQYPAYWVEIFRRQGFVAIDCLRKEIWDNPGISWWYRQNLVFFVKETALASFPLLKEAYELGGGRVLSMVHPELLKWKDTRLKYFQKNLQNPIRTIGYYLKKIIGK